MLLRKSDIIASFEMVRSIFCPLQIISSPKVSMFSIGQRHVHGDYGNFIHFSLKQVTDNISEGHM